MRFFALVVLLSGVAGCASYWSHPNYSPQRWAEDYSECEARGGVASGHYDSYGIIRERVTHNCLVGKGWEKQ